MGDRPKGGSEERMGRGNGTRRQASERSERVRSALSKREPKKNGSRAKQGDNRSPLPRRGDRPKQGGRGNGME